MYRGNIWRFFLVHGLNHFLLWLPIWVVFMQGKGLSLTQIGLFDGVVWLGMAALEIPTGGLADRYGRKASILAGTILNAVAMFLVLTETLSPAFVVGYLLWGGAFTFISGADLAFLYDSLKADGREAEAAKQNGRYTAVLQAAQAIAAVLGAWLATIDPPLCFLFTGIAGLAAAVVGLTFKEPPRVAEGERALGYWANLRVALRITVRDARVRWLVLLSALMPVTPFILNFVLIQPYAIAVGLPIAALGVLVATSRLTGIAGATVGHRTTGRISLGRLTFASIAVTIGSAGTLALVPSIPALALVPLITLLGSLVRPLIVAHLNHLIPSAQRATIISLSSLAFSVALAVGEPAILWIADRYGAATALGASALGMGLIVVPIAALWRRAEHREVAVPLPEPVPADPAIR